MRWSNVKLIVHREVRDQLRDRRTLATVVLLPLLLYPLLGLTVMQVAEFLQEHPTKIWIIGASSLPDTPKLFDGNEFSREVCSNDDERKLLQLTYVNSSEAGATPADIVEAAQRELKRGRYAAVVYFPPQFGEQLQLYRQSLDDTDKTGKTDKVEQAEAEPAHPPNPQVYFHAAKDRSRVAHDRLAGVLKRWQDKFSPEGDREEEATAKAETPFVFQATDVAEPSTHRAAIWAKVLPFVVLVWALTGAFYPAVDLCAGEKERGTLETLLCSPARRVEIVWGKLLTVMVFSIATSVLNLASMCATGWFLVSRLGALSGGALSIDLGPPPLMAAAWLLVALVPISALFSALALAIASFARSTKEGQYYLMPLLMIMLPLMMLPMTPTAQLNLGMSLIPVSGVVFLLRALLEGEHASAALYAWPVIGVTLASCLLAIRWAVDQFNDESVLFGQSERFGLTAWLRHVVRDRHDTPSVGEAVLCGVLILLARFFVGFLAPPPTDWTSLAVTTMIVQIALIAAPAMLMAIMLTRSARKTLLFAAPKPLAMPGAVMLALLLHPVMLSLSVLIQRLYPMSHQTYDQLAVVSRMIAEAPIMWVLLAFALAPAICEELAFRGFVLAGFRGLGKPRAGIVFSAVLFGVAHGVLQQSLSAMVSGLLLGWLAVHTRSLLPCVAFHFTHNSLMLLLSRLPVDSITGGGAWSWLLRPTSEGLLYHGPVVAVCGVLSLMLTLKLSSYLREQACGGVVPSDGFDLKPAANC